MSEPQTRHYRWGVLICPTCDRGLEEAQAVVDHGSLVHAHCVRV